MKRPQLNALVDGLAFVALLFLLTTGLLLEYQLPAGSGGLEGFGHGRGNPGREIHVVWGWTRHEWGRLHYWIALGMMAVLAFHLLLHWKWIVCTLRGKPSTASGYRLLLGVVGFVFTILLSIMPLLSERASVTRGELRESRADVADALETADELKSIRGSMTLTEISEATGVSLSEIIEKLGLPSDVDVNARAGSLMRQYHRQMSDLREALRTIPMAPESQHSD